MPAAIFVLGISVFCKIPISLVSKYGLLVHGSNIIREKQALHMFSSPILAHNSPAQLKKKIWGDGSDPF